MTLWYGVLRKSGASEVKRLWKPGEDRAAGKLPSTAEVFGPFEAPGFPAAKIKFHAIADAVGFTLSPNGIFQK